MLPIRKNVINEKEEKALDIFNLRKITDATAAAHTSFEHTGLFLREIRKILDTAFSGLFTLDRGSLKVARERQRELQRWSNIIAANIFKVLRLLGRELEAAETARFAKTISSLQEISESVRDVVLRSHVHVSNHHSGLLEAQKSELENMHQIVDDILERASETMTQRGKPDHETVAGLVDDLRDLGQAFDASQVQRIQDNSSKTRLSILSYSLTWDCLKIAEQTAALLTVFEDPFRPTLDGSDEDSSSIEAAS